MAFRRVLEELEAKLEPVDQSTPSGCRGKLELKHYGDGRRRMKIKCVKLDLADGAPLQLVSGGAVVAVLEARNGRAALDEERDESVDFPALAAGDTVTLCHQGAALLSGRVYVD